MSNIELFLKSIQEFLCNNQNQVSVSVLVIGIVILFGVILILYNLTQNMPWPRSKRCKKNSRGYSDSNNRYRRERFENEEPDKELFYNNGSHSNEDQTNMNEPFNKHGSHSNEDQTNMNESFNNHGSHSNEDQTNTNEPFNNHGSHSNEDQTNTNEPFYNHGSHSNEDQTNTNEPFYNTDDEDEYYDDIKDDEDYEQTAEIVKDTIAELKKSKEKLTDKNASKPAKQKAKKLIKDNKQILKPLIDINNKIKNIQEKPSVVISDIKRINKDLVKATLSIKCGMYKKEVEKFTDRDTKDLLNKAVETTQAEIDIINDADKSKKDLDLKQRANIVITAELFKMADDKPPDSVKDKINAAKLDIIVEPKILENKLKENPTKTSLADKLDIAITKADIVVKGETPQNKEDSAKAFVVLKEQVLKTTEPNSKEHQLYKEKCKSIVNFEQKNDVNSTELTKINTILTEEIKQNKSILQYLKENNQINKDLLSKMVDLSNKLNKEKSSPDMNFSASLAGFDNNLAYAEFKI